MPLMHSSLSLYTKCHAANIEHKTAATQSDQVWAKETPASPDAGQNSTARWGAAPGRVTESNLEGLS